MMVSVKLFYFFVLMVCRVVVLNCGFFFSICSFLCVLIIFGLVVCLLMIFFL